MRQGIFFFPESTFCTDSLSVSVHPRVQSHALTSVRTSYHSRAQWWGVAIPDAGAAWKKLTQTVVLQQMCVADSYSVVDVQITLNVSEMTHMQHISRALSRCATHGQTVFTMPNNSLPWWNPFSSPPPPPTLHTPPPHPKLCSRFLQSPRSCRVVAMMNKWQKSRSLTSWCLWT